MTTYTCKKINAKCKECSGKCYDASSNSKTQENARKMFGITPNECVPDENGTSRCPFK